MIGRRTYKIIHNSQADITKHSETGAKSKTLPKSMQVVCFSWSIKTNAYVQKYTS